MKRPKYIILEGSDGTGKTTLAAELKKQRFYEILHAGPPTKEDWSREYIEPLRDSTSQLVLDRWHIGEWVWPDIFGRKSLFSGFKDFMACHGMLVEMGAVVYIMTRDPADILEELGLRGETENQMDQAMDGFSQFAELGAMGLPNVLMGDLPTARVVFELDGVIDPRAGDRI